VHKGKPITGLKHSRELEKHDKILFGVNVDIVDWRAEL